MRHCFARPIAAGLLTASLWIPPAMSQSVATIEVRVSGAPENTDFEAIAAHFEPQTVFVDSNLASKFDDNLGGWKAVTRPLAGLSTSVTISLKDSDGSLLHIPIVLELPFRTQRVPIDILQGTEPHIDRMMDYYRRNGDLDAEDRLRAFVIAEGVIQYLQGLAPASSITISAPLARALIVYAEAVDLLLQRTEWFGRPRALSDRLDMVKHIEADAPQRVRDDIKMDRLERAEASLRNADAYLITREYQYSVRQAAFCLDRFPNALALYDFLATMSREAYQDIVKRSQITESLALLAATQCYRELLTVDGTHRRALPDVVSGPFKGKSAAEMARGLRADIEHELETVEGPADGAAPQCSAVDPNAHPKAELCDGLAFLEEVAPLLVE